MLPADIDPEFVKPGDTHTLRVSVRHDDTHGYVFVNNYQRRLTMDDHKDVVLEGKQKVSQCVFLKQILHQASMHFIHII